VAQRKVNNRETVPARYTHAQGVVRNLSAPLDPIYGNEAISPLEVGGFSMREKVVCSCPGWFV